MWRHMYGKEGKRHDYQAFNCNAIHNSNAPNANEHHGCPFKHHSVNQVTHMLGKLGISGPQLTPIIANMQSHNPNLACLEHFKVAHPHKVGSRPVDMDNVGNHPNAWFKSSVDYYRQDGSNSNGNNSSPATADKIMSMNDSSPSSTGADEPSPVTPNKE